MMFIAMLVGLLVAMLVAISRSILGPTVYDRMLAVNSFGTKVVLLIPVYGFMTERPEFIDIALAYALINFIGTIAILKYFELNYLVGNQFQHELGVEDTESSANKGNAKEKDHA